MYGNSKVYHVYAQSLNGVIGINQTIPWRCKADMRHFAKTTRHNVVIMGRNTFYSIPGLLKDRTVIVLTSKRDLVPHITNNANHYTAPTVREALALADKLSPNKEIYVIGGGQVYEQTAQYVDHVVRSIINVEVEGDCHVSWEDKYRDDVFIENHEFDVDEY